MSAITFQPYASKRRTVSSRNQCSTSPSIEMPLSSYSTTSFDSPQVPASEQASWDSPSIRHPSPAKTQVKWSTTGKPSRLNSTASSRSASAMPTALAIPCPSGPVVVSMPAA